MRKLGNHSPPADRSPAVTFSIRLTSADLESIRAIAEINQVGPTQLVRRWVLERLALEKRAGSLANLTSPYPADIERLVRKTAVDAVLGNADQVVERVVAAVINEMHQEAQLEAEAMAVPI